MNKLSILCVEPDAESRALLADLLEDFDAAYASTAYEAVAKLCHGVFDAYVLELWLPDFSGEALCREIRRTDLSGPVVFCTGAARVEDERRAMRAGAQAYLRKPVDPASLLETLCTLTAESHASSVRARAENERVIAATIASHCAQIATRGGPGVAQAREALKRAIRPDAYVSFARCGGTWAYFERAWEEMYEAAWARVVPADRDESLRGSLEN